jgi:predicted benzoate:H+ symporter BenE
VGQSGILGLHSSTIFFLLKRPHSTSWNDPGAAFEMAAAIALRWSLIIGQFVADKIRDGHAPPAEIL